METTNCTNGVLNTINEVLTEDDIKKVVFHDDYAMKNYDIVSYEVNHASNKMLGFLADYWRLTVKVSDTEDNKVLSYFIKAVSRTNAAKAAMVKELKLFDKELYFYCSVKTVMDVPELKPWSAKLVTTLQEAIVFQDLNSLNYKLRNKFERFDNAHTLQALKTLARFHASTIIYEERKTKELNRQFSVKEEFTQISQQSGYNDTDSWFVQCRQGALEALKMFSKYKDSELMSDIENQWISIWSRALRVSEQSSHRNVICHRDLWNNNLLFHYDDGAPDDCLFVDFQAVSFQPPAGDVMLLLYCNFDPQFREANLSNFLKFYYEELKTIISNFGFCLGDIIDEQDFLASAGEQRLWGLIACACLMPQFWLDDELTTKTFCDTAQFDEILSRDKGSFIKRNMQTNKDYREHVMEIFEEIVERYCTFN